MDFRVYKSFIVFVIMIILLSGCVDTSDSEEGENTGSNVDFRLFPSNYFTDYDVSANLVGSDSRGYILTGSITERTLPISTFLGEDSVEIEIKTEFTASNNAGVALATVNSHYNTDTNNRRFLGVSSDVETVSATTSVIPQTAKIGDSGSIGVYISNASFETTLSWRLEDGLNGNAKLIFSDTTNNQSGDPDNTFTTTYLIRPDGTRLSVQLETYSVGANLRVVLSGDY